MKSFFAIGFILIVGAFLIGCSNEQPSGEATDAKTGESDALKTTGDTTGDVANEGAKKTAGALDTAGQATGNALRTAGDATQGGIQKAAGATADSLSKAGEATKNALETAGKAISGSGKKPEEKKKESK